VNILIFWAMSRLKFYNYSTPLERRERRLVCSSNCIFSFSSESMSYSSANWLFNLFIYSTVLFASDSMISEL